MATLLGMKASASTVGCSRGSCCKAVSGPIRAMSSARRLISVRSQAASDSTTQLAKTLSVATVASSWMMAGHAQAATELASLAASDNRFGTIALLFVPALGWVAFNILQPFFNQLSSMEAAKAGGQTARKRARSVAAIVGLGAALATVAADKAEAANEIAQAAATDNRFATIALLFVPALGWVLFNILQPLQNQLSNMADEGTVPKPKGRKKRAVAAGLGLGAASLLMAEQAEAITEVSQIAASDNRFGTIALLFLPAVAWVLFNIGQPLLNQLDRMSSEGTPVKSRKKRGIAAVVGLGASSLLMAGQADAATEVAQLAAGDNRFGTIALLFLPALFWVGFNILQPLQGQLSKMEEQKQGPVRARR